MDKLSSILPTSPRVQAVDMSDAQPVRPGTPTFGRPVGSNVVKDRLSVSQQAKDMAFKETLAGMNPRDAKGAKIADDMYKKFFDQKVNDGFKTKAGSEETQERQFEMEEELPINLKVSVPAIKTEATNQRPPRLDLEA